MSSEVDTILVSRYPQILYSISDDSVAYITMDKRNLTNSHSSISSKIQVKEVVNGEYLRILEHEKISKFSINENFGNVKDG